VSRHIEDELWIPARASRCPFQKFHPVGIRAVRQNHWRPYSFRRLGGFEVDDQLVFGRLPDRPLGVTMLPLSRLSKAVDMPDGRAKAVRPPDGVDEP
jgi:hypothetical protein